MSVPAPQPASRPRREQNKGRVREALQSSCVRLVAEHGMDKVSVEQILEDAGYSRRTFYVYFANKLELLASVMNPVFEEGTSILEDVLKRSSRDLLDGISECYLALWNHHRNALLAIASLSDPAIAPYIESGHRKFGSTLQRVLHKAANANMLRNRDASFSFKVISKTAVPLLKIYDSHPDGEQLYRESMLALLQAADETDQ